VKYNSCTFFLFEDAWFVFSSFALLVVALPCLSLFSTTAGQYVIWHASLAIWLLLKVWFSIGFTNLWAKCGVAISHCNGANIGLQPIYLPQSVSFSGLCMRSVMLRSPTVMVRISTHNSFTSHHKTWSCQCDILHNPTSRNWFVDLA